VESWLAERGSPLVVRVTPLADERVITRLDASWGLERADETVVLTKRLVPGPPGLGVLVGADDPHFASESLRLNERPGDSIDAWTRMVRRLGADATGIWEQGRAGALATVADSIAAIYSVAVEAPYRRSGLATGITKAAESWATERGANDAFLQVQADNLAARALYARLGYKERYRYHYLQPQATPAAIDTGIAP
jgi:ribosomal protein S18 acetylase RimI-like enzyme